MSRDLPKPKVARGPSRCWRLWGGVCHCYRPVPGRRLTNSYESQCGRSTMPGRVILTNGTGGRPVCRPPVKMRCPECYAGEKLIAPGLMLPATCDVPMAPIDPDNGW